MIIVPQMLDTVTVNVSDDAAAWDQDQTYSCGDKVVYGTMVWLSATDANTGHLPDSDDGYWILWAPANRSAALMITSAAATVCDAGTSTGGAPYDLEISFDIPSGADAAVLYGIDGSGATIRALDGQGDVIVEWSTSDPSLGVRLPSDATSVSISITERDGSSSLRYLVVGSALDIGCATYDLSIGYAADRQIDRDPSGVSTVRTHEVVSEVSFATTVETSRVPGLRESLRRIYDLPVAAVGEERDDPKLAGMVTTGVLTGASITPDVRRSSVSVDIKEVV